MKSDRASSNANISMLILSVLADGPLHGYGIAREIERRSGHQISPGEGALYPALRNLETDGCVVASWQTQDNGPARKVYALTINGVDDLNDRARSWRGYVDAVESVIARPA
ncbi:MAG: PadR family transcriptional regulator [Capsulimonadaceae bacterium]|nr:PadR family transcriptional regulator [Capsulimonadaceae bacterium]